MANSRPRPFFWAAVMALVLASCTDATSTSVTDEAPTRTTTEAVSSPTTVPESSTVGSDPISLPHPDDWDPIEQCDPTVEPRRGDPARAMPPVSGPVELEVVGRLGGIASAATLEGDTLYAGTGSQVVQVELADAARPREAATSDPLPGQVEEIRAAGDLLVVAAGEGGLAILDRRRLELRSTLPLPGYAEALAVDGGHAYVADGPGGLRIVDITDPDRPAEIGVVLDLHLILGVAVAGERAFLAAADEGLIVVDVSDPAAPVEVGRLFTGGYAYGVALAGDRVLLADAWGGLRVIDATNPRAPRLVATVPTAGWTLGVRVEGERAYLAEGSTMRVLEIASIELRQPEALHEFSASTTAVDVAGDRVVLVDGEVGIRILDLGEDGPVELATYAPYAPVGPFHGVAVTGDRAYLGAGFGAGFQGLRIVDVSDPRQPTEVAHIREAPADIATAVGANVFVGAGQLLIGLDTNDPELRPQLRQNVGELYGNIAGISTTVDGSLIYVAGESAYRILDGGSAVPCRLGTLDMFAAGSEAFAAAAIVGDLAYMGGDTFWIADVSDPRAPILLGTSGAGDVVFKVDGMVAVGQTLYAIADTEFGSAVAVYDLAVPMEPRLQGLLRLPIQPPPISSLRGPVYGGGLLWVADGAAGLLAIDVSDPTQPALAGRLRLPGEVVGLVVVGDRAYVVADGGGFFIVEWSAGPTARFDDAGSSARSDDAVPEAVPAVLRPAAAPAFHVAQATSQCLVTSTGDAGPGTLRACVEVFAGSGTQVRFDPQVFPPDEPATIRLGSPLPALPDNVTIDGSGAGVVLDGADLPEPDEDPWASNNWEGGDHGLRVGSGSVVRGLTITGFSGTGIFVRGGGNTIADNVVSANRTNGIVLGGPDNRVVGNLIGLDPSGAAAWGAQRQGVWLTGHDRNVIGGPEPEDRNVISGNQIDVVINSSDNTVQGNYIGTDATGSIRIRKNFAGLPGEALSGAITFDCCSDETGETARNRIVGNVVVWGGISIVGPTTRFNEVVGNLFGLDATGTRWLGGTDHGPPIISVGPAQFNRIGGSLPGEGNVGDFSIGVSGHVVVLGNQLGVDTGGRPLVTPYHGSGSINVEQRGPTIGGRSPGAGNLVVGDGMIVRAAGSATVLGNRIRATTISFASLEEFPVGIRVVAGTGIQLIANTVEAVDGIGVLLTGEAFGTVVRGNVLRDSATGVLARAGSEGSLIARNGFEGNRLHAGDDGTANAWDDGRRGNWWSDPDGVDADGDGIYDAPHEIPPAGIDRYPLAQPP